MLLSLAVLLTSAVGTTWCYISMSSDPITNVFVPEDEMPDGLVISKTIEHALGNSHVIPDHIRFPFTVELGGYYANAKITTTEGEMTADENGTLTVFVKPDVPFGIQGLKEGTEVTVTEEESGMKGFAVKGEAVKTATVGADGTAKLEFVNIYTAEAVRGDGITLTGAKLLEGREWQKGDRFTFVLEQKVGEEWTKLGEKTVAYRENNDTFNHFDFNRVFRLMTFEKAGVYEFRVSESAGKLENVDYDKTVNHFTVLVTDTDMDGKLEIGAVAGTGNVTVQSENGSYAVMVTFNNKYLPPDTPSTGDTGSVTFWFVLMVISGSAFVALAVYDRKCEKA